MTDAATTLPARIAEPSSPARSQPALPRRTWKHRLRGRYRWIVLCGLLAAAIAAVLGGIAGNAYHLRQLDQLAQSRERFQQLQARRAELDQQIRDSAAPFAGGEREAKLLAHANELQRVEAVLAQTRLALASAIPVLAERGDDPGLAREHLERMGRSDPELRRLLDQREQAERRLESLRRRMGPSAGEVVSTRRDLEQISDRIADHVVSVRAMPTGTNGTLDLPLTAEELSQRERRLVALRDRTRDELEQLREADAKLAALLPLHGSVAAQLDETRSRIDRLASATTDRAVARDRMRVMGAVIGAAVGLLPGLLLVPALALLTDGRIRRPDAAELSDPAAPLFGTVPALAKHRLESDASDRTAMSIHEIRALIQIRAERDGARAFAITSPGRGAGKTSLTVGLASSLALSGTRTLLVDCDLAGRQSAAEAGTSDAAQASTTARQNLDQVMLQMGYLDDGDPEVFLLSHDTSVGIIGILDGQPLEQCVVETSVPGLSVLPALAAKPEHIGRMSTRFVRALIEQAQNDYDMVIFDTGPVPGSVEALVVTSAADATIVVVPNGERRSALERAIGHLRMAGARIAGTVFNRADDADLTVQAAAGSKAKKRPRGEADKDNLRRTPTVRQITGSGLLAAAVHTQASSVIPSGGGKRRSREETEQTRKPPGQSVSENPEAADADREASFADAGDITAILQEELAEEPPSKPHRQGGWRAAATTSPPSDAPRTTDPELESALDELVNDARSTPKVRNPT